jgi:hypothetical protein
MSRHFMCNNVLFLWFVSRRDQTLDYAVSKGMKIDIYIGKDLKGSWRSVLEVLSRNFCGGTEKTNSGSA